MPRASENTEDFRSQITFRLLKQSHRSALSALAKSHGLSIHEQARRMVEGSLERSEGKDSDIEMLRLEVSELRGSVERIERGLELVLTHLVAGTPGPRGELPSQEKAREFVRAAFGEEE